MISCIICSANKELLKQVTVSIGETIGLPFEIIGVDNSDGKYSICEAYNKGAGLAKFDVLCFLHEDILFESENWGAVLIQHFNNLEAVGVIGIAGSSYKSLAPSGWWAAGDDYLFYNYRQTYKHAAKETSVRAMNNKDVKRVVCLDGVFLAVKKDVFEKYRFDNALPFFHGYDLDFTLAVSTGFTNYFIPDIMLHHLSEGKWDNTWLENMYLVFKKWKNHLPIVLAGKENDKTESHIWQEYCRQVLSSTLPVAKKNNILWKVMWYMSWQRRSCKPFYGLLRSMLFFILKKVNLLRAYK